MTSIIYETKDFLPWQRIRNTLRAPTTDLVSTLAPTGKVKQNAVFVNRINTDTAGPYWRSDGYRWRFKRTRFEPRENAWCRVAVFRLVSNRKEVDFYRTEYALKDCELKPPNAWEWPFVLVHYTGAFNLKDYVSAPHGNRKPPLEKASTKKFMEMVGIQQLPSERMSTTDASPRRRAKKGHLKQVSSPASSSSTMNKNRKETNKSEDTETLPPFVPTHPDVRKKLREHLLQNKKPKQAEMDCIRDTLRETEDADLSKLPRNTRQSHNVQHQIKKAQTHDDIYEVYRLAMEQHGIIPFFKLVPQLVLIQMSSEIADHFKKVKEVETQVILHYDTTFNIGKFFTSILSFRHPNFESKPVIPLAVVYHETTKENSHEDFFREIVKLLEINDPKIVIISDREKSIVNAISTYLDSAVHLSCWNHIEQNVERYVSKKLRLKSKVGKYQNEVIQLLKSASEVEFEKLLTKLKKTWDFRFEKYFANHLKEDLFRSSRFVLEKLGLYNPLSGITNNPAESANKSFQEKISPNSTLFQAASAWYFHQNDAFLDIVRGAKKSGNYLLSKPFHSKIPLPELSDVVREEFCKSLIYEGKYPPDLPSSTPYDFENIHDVTTMRGSALRIIREEKITWNKKDKVFIVTGLQNIKYCVKLNPVSCQCKRPGTCDHVLAILIAADLENLIKLKRCQPDLGKLYRDLCLKGTGKKAGQKQSRYNVPAKTIELVQRTLKGTTANAAANDVAQENESIRLSDDETDSSESTDQSNPDIFDISELNKSPFDMENDPTQILNQSTAFDNLQSSTDILSAASTDGFSQQKGVIVLCKAKHNYPALTLENAREPVLYLPTGNITRGELLILRQEHSKEEEEILKLCFKSSASTLDWLTSTVVSGFLMMITDRSDQGNISVSSEEANAIFKQWNTSGMFSLGEGKADYHDWEKVNRVFLPVNYKKNHWILLVISAREKEIQVLDPQGLYKPSRKKRQILQTFFNHKFGFQKGTEWIVSYPVKRETSGIDSTQCGPYICFYGEAIVSGSSLLDMPNIKSYREHIYATLTGGCSFDRCAESETCIRCTGLVADVYHCDFCRNRAHPHCMNEIIIRGLIRYVCP